jgi:DNA invertase Pin-like site-specific DNA recombinase
LFNQLSTFAEFERDTIVERSAAGKARYLDAGAWQDRCAPFGFAVQGKDKDARLVLDEPPFPGLSELSPAGVVRLTFDGMGL